MTIREMAKLHGMNPYTIRRAIHAGEISAVMVDGKYVIPDAEARRWNPRPPHRPVRDVEGVDRYTIRLPRSWRPALEAERSGSEVLSEVLRRLLEPTLSPF